MVCRSFQLRGLAKASIDRINKELLQKCNLIEPTYIPVVEQVTYQGKEIIVLWIPGGADRPYKCPVAFPTEKRQNQIRLTISGKCPTASGPISLEERSCSFGK